MIKEDRKLSPMLIGKESAPFDNVDYLYELKLDGIRCLAYISKDKVELRNKRNIKLNDKFPELTNIYQQVKKDCVLDGELYIFKDGVLDFFEIQKRTLSEDKFKIRYAAQYHPACFTAFDCLYVEDICLLQKPLIKRKAILENLIEETERINISRYIESEGCKLFAETKRLNLEGIVAKRKDSLYYCGKHTTQWIKCKHLLDDDFIIVGYIPKAKGVVSLVLAQFYGKVLVYKGHVSMSGSLAYLYKHCQKSDINPFPFETNNVDAIWIEPKLVGAVKFMSYTKQGGLRQPVFKGFREDKTIQECQVKERNT